MKGKGRGKKQVSATRTTLPTNITDQKQRRQTREATKGAPGTRGGGALLQESVGGRCVGGWGLTNLSDVGGLALRKGRERGEAS